MSIRAEFSVMWITHPQWFNVRRLLGVPDWITETCCVQLSHAMNAAGLPVTPPIKRTWKSKYGKKHFLAVAEMRAFLKQQWGNPDVDSMAPSIDKDLGKFKKAISGRQGIIVFGERHIDLWNGERIHGERYLPDALWKARSTRTLGILLWEVTL